MDNTVAQNEYRITIAQNRLKRHQVTALHLMIGFLLLLMGVVTWMVPSSIKTDSFAFLNIAGIAYAAFGLCLILVSVFFNRRLIQNPSGNQLLRIIEALVLLSILVYTLLQKWYLPFGYSAAALLVIVFAYLWEKDAQSAKVVTISERGVYIPGFFKSQNLPWQDISRVIIKHAILTIDCQNNHLYQFSVTDITADDSEEPLSVFSMRMIAAHKHLPKSDW